MKVFLTGGTGFFGRALLRYWALSANRPDTVCVLTRNPLSFVKKYPEFADIPWVSFVEGDVLKEDAFPLGWTFSHVLHAATESTSGPSLSPLERYEHIVAGTKNTLNFARACGAKRFLLTSSGGVYGPQPQDLQTIPESYCGMPDPLMPDNAYSVAKRAAEHLCALYSQTYGLHCVIARCFAFVGRDLPLDAHFAVGNFIRDALFSSCIKINGDGMPTRSYLDQRDLAEWLWCLLDQGQPGEAYNVGSDQEISLKELAFLIRDLIAPEKQVQILGKTVSQHRTRYVPDISKVTKAFNLKRRFSLEEAINDVVKQGVG